VALLEPDTRWPLSLQNFLTHNNHGVHFPKGYVQEILKKTPIQLGGEGVLCQVDESIFAQKRKHHQAEDQKLTDGYGHCLFITVYKYCKTVIVKYEREVQYILYIKSVN
jgi:hypothetical protein